jgi:hypothetical protein
VERGWYVTTGLRESWKRNPHPHSTSTIETQVGELSERGEGVDTFDLILGQVEATALDEGFKPA